MGEKEQPPILRSSSFFPLRRRNLHAGSLSEWRVAEEEIICVFVVVALFTSVCHLVDVEVVLRDVWFGGFCFFCRPLFTPPPVVTSCVPTSQKRVTANRKILTHGYSI